MAGMPASAHAGFVELDGDAEGDLGPPPGEPLVAGAFLEVGGDRLEPQHCGLVEGAAQKPELDLVEGIECAAAVFHHTAAALDRILDALQRDQRIDAADGAQRQRRAWRRGRPALGDAEGSAGGTPRQRGGGGKGGAVRSSDAHMYKVSAYG